jgi:hypothetical protein
VSDKTKDKNFRKCETVKIFKNVTIPEIFRNIKFFEDLKDLSSSKLKDIQN